MKKTYSKPEIAFESFTLNTNIAGDCGVKVEGSNAGTCGIEWAGKLLFLSGIEGCKNPVTADDGSSGFCYDVPTDASGLFNS